MSERSYDDERRGVIGHGYLSGVYDDVAAVAATSDTEALQSELLACAANGDREGAEDALARGAVANARAQVTTEMLEAVADAVG